MAEKKDNKWEKNVIEKIATDSLLEQKKQGDGGFSLNYLHYLTLVLFYFLW